MKIQTLTTSTEEKFCKVFSVQSYNNEMPLKGIHRHSFYQIMILKKGRMRHFVDFEWKNAEAPCVSVLYPNQVHMLELSKDAEAEVIMFDESVYCDDILHDEIRDYNIDLKKRLNLITDIAPENWHVINVISDHLLFLKENDNALNREQSKLFIKTLLLKLIEIAPMIYPFEDIDRDLKYYQRFVEAINKKFIAQKKVQDYSKELRISTKKLSLVCKKYSGCTPLELIHEQLSLELKRMIVEDGMMLKDIAKSLDFSSQPALNKFIERQFGNTPHKWKLELERSMEERMEE